MADYTGLPPIPKTAVADTTGKNPANYSAVFQASDFATQLPVVEIPRIVITGGLVLASIQVWVATQLFDTALVGFGGLTVWSARNPMILKPGNEVWVLFGIPVSGNSAPQVTLWPRYDAAIPANQAAVQ